MANNYDFMFKIVLIGDCGVGKTQILEQFCGSPDLPPSNIGREFNDRIVEIQGRRIKLQIWDTAGQERYSAIWSTYCRGAKGIVLVYDVADARTLHNLSQWISKARQASTADVEMIVLGYQQKMDSIREVRREEGEALAVEHGIRYLEASANDNISIETAFMDLTHAILNTAMDLPPDPGDLDNRVNLQA